MTACASAPSRSRRTPGSTSTTTSERRRGGSSGVDELAKLAELKEKGAISDAEFQQAKAKLLA